MASRRRPGWGISLREIRTSPDQEIMHAADAAVRAAKINHYMIGLTHKLSDHVAEGAKQVIYTWENDGQIKEVVVDRALFLIEEAKRK